MQTSSHLTSTTLKSVTEGSQGAWVAAWELLIGSRKSKNWELVSSSVGVKQQGGVLGGTAVIEPALARHICSHRWAWV